MHRWVPCCRQSRAALLSDTDAVRQVPMSESFSAGNSPSGAGKSALLNAVMNSVAPEISSGQTEAFVHLFSKRVPLLINLNQGIIGKWDPNTWLSRYGSQHYVSAQIVPHEQGESHDVQMRLDEFLAKFVDSTERDSLKLSVRSCLIYVHRLLSRCNYRTGRSTRNFRLYVLENIIITTT